MRIRAVALVALACLVAGVVPARGITVNESGFHDHQWNMKQIGGPGMWDLSTGAGVIVGVVDSGVDVTHPELRGRVSAWNCTGTSGGGDQCAQGGVDEHGHGTHVTGIVASALNNDQGFIVGTAPASSVVVAKIFRCNNDDCSASVDDLEAGIELVLSKGAKIINLSLGDAGLFGSGLFCDNTRFSNLLNQIWDAGAVAVFAAGNCGSGFVGGSANFRNVNALVVAATGPSGERTTTYSNSLTTAKYGLMAPGGDANSCSGGNQACILSTWPQSKIGPGQAPYAWLQGTSMAAPHVAGALAALMARGLNRDAAVATVMAHLDKISCGTDCQGRLNLGKALASLGPPGGGAGGGGAATTTPTTRPGSPAPPRRPSSTRPPTPATASTVPGETTTTGGFGDELGLLDEDDDDFEASRAPSGDGRPDEQDDRPPAGPTAVALLGLLGVGGVGVPLVWRRFRPFG